MHLNNIGRNDRYDMTDMISPPYQGGDIVWTIK